VESILQRALADFPGSSQRKEWMRLLGESLVEQEKWELAQALYTQAVAEFPEQRGFTLSFGWAIYEATGDFNAAKSQFEKAISLDVDSAAGYAAIGQLLGREERFAEADEWLRQAIEKNPQQSYYYLLRANFLRSAGELRQAIQQYNQMAELFPDETDAYYHLALAYKMDDQPTQAMEAIEKAIRLALSPQINYYLRAAEIYEWAGDIPNAVEAFENVLLIDPQNQDAIEGIERLR
jgi:tetratricopeptide (TPR) repeat protein